MTADAKARIMHIRQEMVSNCNWGVGHAAGIHYAQARPMPVGLPRFSLPITTDSSGFATLMAKWSGAGDPNGCGFNGYGNTGTMLAHSEHIQPAESQPGDFVVFGLCPSTHVAVLLESAAGGHDPLCVSHSRRAGPLRVRLSAARPRRGEQVTFLRLLAGGDRPLARMDGNPFIPLAVDGSFGPLTTKAVQWELGVPTDGVFGTVTKKALQRYLLQAPDGIIGPVTMAALQEHIGAAGDGYGGPLTTQALQRALNAGRF